MILSLRFTYFNCESILIQLNDNSIFELKENKTNHNNTRDVNNVNEKENEELKRE